VDTVPRVTYPLSRAQGEDKPAVIRSQRLLREVYPFLRPVR